MAVAEAVSLKEYFARTGSRFDNKDAQYIGPILEQIGPKCNKELVDYARPVGSPLHRYFEWDDSRAAEYYRRLQAGDMVNSIRIRVVSPDGEREETAAFHKVSVTTIDPNDERKDNRGQPLKVSVSTSRVINEEPMRIEVLSRARAELLAFKRKWASYAELFGWKELFEVIDRISEHADAEDLAAD